MYVLDFENKKYNPDLFNKFLIINSRWEIIMARFFIGVLRHDNDYNFYFVDAAVELDES